jgi:anti-anti-sigma factor
VGEGDTAGSVGDAEVVRAGFDALPVPVVLLEGPQHRLVGMNAAYRAFSGRDAVIGRPMREAFPEMEPAELFDSVERVYDTGEPWHARECPVSFDPGDGHQRLFYLDFDVLPRHAADGTVCGSLIMQTDVTERVTARRVAEAAAAEAEARYRVAHQVVVELQQALLPPGVPVLPTVDLAARYLVAGAEQSAGGDWFDVAVLPGGRIGLVVGDVVGHGVAAAAVMSQLRAVLADALETTADPAAAVVRLERFAATVPAAAAATVVVAVLDPDTGTLDYLTRGHPAPLLVDASGQGRYLLTSGGGPLGGEPGGPPQRATVDVGDVVVLFSDGLVERRDRPYPDGLDELARRVEAAVATSASRTAPGAAPGGESPVRRICAEVVDQLTADGFDDDVTVLAVGRTPALEPVHAHAAATAGELAELRREVREWLTALRIDTAEQIALEIAVGEAVDNAVEHGFEHATVPGSVTVDLALAGDGRVHARVVDSGAWREPADGSRTWGRGRGLSVLGSVGEDLVVAGTPEGTTVRFHRRLTRPTTSSTPNAVAPRDSGSLLPGTAASFETRSSDDPPVLHLRGALEVFSVDALRRELARASAGGTVELVVDLSEVTHLTSVGVAALAETLRAGQRSGHPAVLLAPTGSPAAFVLDLVGLPRGTSADTGPRG